MTYENQTTANANAWTLCALVFAEKQCGNQTLQHNCMRDGRAEHSRHFGINLSTNKIGFFISTKSRQRTTFAGSLCRQFPFDLNLLNKVGLKSYFLKAITAHNDELSAAKKNEQQPT